MVRTMSTHDAVLELNQKMNVANFLGVVQTGLQASTARSSAVTAVNTAATARAAEATAREAARQTALLHDVSDELDYQSELQEHILHVERETNQHVQSIDSNLQETNRLIGEGLKEQREANQTLRSIEGSANLTNRLLAAQLRGMGAIAGILDDSKRIQFANWRDGTDAGKEYLRWSQQAGRIIRSIGKYTKRMSVAREQDYQLNLKALIAQDARGVMGRPEPQWQEPALPAEPVEQQPEAEMPVAPTEPSKPKRAETEDAFDFDDETDLWSGGFTLIGLIVGVVVAVSVLKSFLFGFLAICLFSFLGYVAGLFLGLAVLEIKLNRRAKRNRRMTPNREGEEARYAAAWIQYQDAKRAYDEELSNWQNEHARRATEHAQWRAECDRIYNACVQQYRQQLQQYHQDRADFLNYCVRHAWELVSSDTAWSVDNVSRMSARLSNIIKNVPTNPPAQGTLPKLRLPILASVGSLPATAPHMRLELAKMIKDNVNNDEMRVATPKEGEDPFAPYPFASASAPSTSPMPPAPSGRTMPPAPPAPPRP